MANSETQSSLPSPWDDYVNAIRGEIESHLQHHPIVVVPTDDVALLQLLMRATEAKWVRFEPDPIVLPLWTRMGVALLGDDVPDDWIKYLDQPETFLALLKRELARRPATKSRLVATVEETRLAETAREFAYLRWLIASGNHDVSAVLFTTQTLRDPPAGISVLRLEALFGAFRTSTAKAFERCSNLHSRNNSFSEALINGIVGIAGYSVASAQDCITILDRPLPVMETLQPEEAEREHYQYRVLLLIERRLPKLLLDAERNGILGEVVFGLQGRSFLEEGSEAGPGAVVGENLPVGYGDAISDLALLRWLKDLFIEARFTGTEHIRSIRRLGQTAPVINEEPIARLVRSLAAKLASTPVSEQSGSDRVGGRTTDPNESILMALSTVSLLGLGYAPSSVSAGHKGLSVLAAKIDLRSIRLVTAVAECIANWIDEVIWDLNLPIRVSDIRQRLLVLQLAVQMRATMQVHLTRQEEILKHSEASIVNYYATLATSPRLASLIFAWLNTVLQRDKKDDVEIQCKVNAAKQELLDLGIQNARTLLESMRATLGACHSAIARLPVASDKGFQSKFEERFQHYFKLLRVHSAWHLDMRTESLRFQWSLLTGKWTEAQRLLEEFRRLGPEHAEISEGELAIYEAQFMEEQGGHLQARSKYQQLADKLGGPATDPILWARAKYGYLRTDLRVRGKAEIEALSGAIALLDLESQRGANISTLAETANLFVSFSGQFRESVRRLITEIPEPWQSQIDEERGINDDFDPVIHMRLLQSKAILIALSEDYMSSPWCVYELHTALHLARFENRRLGWLYFSGGESNPRVPEFERQSYVRSHIVGIVGGALDSLPLYRSERLDRLFRLADSIGIYGKDDVQAAQGVNAFLELPSGR